MAVENLQGSLIASNYGSEPLTLVSTRKSHGRVRRLVETVEVSAAASVNSTYELARLPAHASICGISKLHFDDLASTGSPTIDLGFFNPDGESGITDDDDALNDGIDVATAAGSVDVLKTPIDQIHKEAWELVSGQTADPQHELILKATLKDAAANTGGTMTLELFYVID